MGKTPLGVFKGTEVDKVEEFVDGGGGGEVPDVDGTLVATFMVPKATLREAGEYCACFDRSQMIRCSYLEVTHLVVVWESPHCS